MSLSCARASVAVSVALVHLLTATALAQALHFGVKAGVPTTTYFQTGRASFHDFREDYSAATRRYIVGASAEWHITDRFGLEVDVLYHRMGYVATMSGFAEANASGFSSAIDVKGNSWDFPLLTKYRFHRVLRSYLCGGGVIRYVGPVRGRGQSTVYNLFDRTSSTTPLDTATPSELSRRFYPGASVAAGAELGHGKVRLLPEFRYTRWLANISGADELLHFPANQAEFLVGVLF